MIRVLTEGRVTEPSYFAALARQFRTSVTVDVDKTAGGRTPRAIVERAVDEDRRNRRARKKGGGPDFDEIWCVFDIDDHNDIAEAIRLAEQHGIGVAVSNPCFEMWLILHAADRSAWISRSDAQQLAGKLGVIDGKRLQDAAALLDTWELACQRAEALADRHHHNGQPPMSNPSSTVSSLVRSISK